MTLTITFSSDLVTCLFRRLGYFKTVCISMLLFLETWSVSIFSNIVVIQVNSVFIVLSVNYLLYIIQTNYR